MYNDRINEIIAHFIGIFDREVDDARMRTKYLEGRTAHDNERPVTHEEVDHRDFSSNLTLADYTPGVSYRIGHYDYDFGKHVGFRPHGQDLVDIDIGRFRAGNPDLDPQWYIRGHADIEIDPHLVVYNGPGSFIGHTVQVNLLQDDDFLDMTDGPHNHFDMSYVSERMAEFYNQADVFTPFATFHRADSYEALQQMAGKVHSYIQEMASKDGNFQETGAQHDLFVSGPETNGHGGNHVWINGELAAKMPDIADFMPERGIAAPETKPEEQEGPLSESGHGGNSLTVAAGANVVANVYAMVSTGVISPVMAVMGDYHQVDSITQSWIYSDRDDVDAVFSTPGGMNTTVASNIASFARSAYDSPASQDTTAEHGSSPVFPTAWRVSTIEGDVSFVNWIEQYNFVTDNDTLKVTTIGSMATVMSGGNAAINLASFLGIGMQYDLVIVGGNVLDMNMISQMAILYDNDTVRSQGGAGAGTTVQSSNNLLWNEASIHNFGMNDRFEAMPDYITRTINAINERDGVMPAGMAADPLFAGMHGINVLYITGNLYDINYIKQVSVLGDADHVTQAMSNVLSNNENATVTIDTGSNAVVNAASIVDYDSFGAKTYLAGQLYSDAVLIQGGIIENDTSVPQLLDGKLANEIIAFLHDDNPGAESSADGIFNGGHDLSWSLAHPVDVMQTVGA